VKEISKDAQYLTLHTEENNFAVQSLCEKEGFVVQQRIVLYSIPENLDQSNTNQQNLVSAAQANTVKLMSNSRLTPSNYCPFLLIRSCR
jgi:hypothetical protein